MQETNNSPQNPLLEQTAVSGSAFDKMKKLMESMTPKYNGMPCKNGCNCIKIAEFENAGESVKNYPCLGC